MLTRPRVRRVMCWVGVVVGGISLLAGIAGAIRGFQVVQMPMHGVAVRRGALEVYWQRQVSFYSAPGVPGPMRSPTGNLWRWLPKWTEPGYVWNGRGLSETPGEFIMPFWIPAAMGLWCVYRLLPERPPTGICAKCGYDLRALPRKDGGAVCPECGTAA